MKTTVIDKYILLYNSIYKNSTRFYVVMHVAPNPVLFAESVDITSFCGACLNFSREKDSAIPFPRRL